LSNCQAEEDVVREEDQINAIYKDETVRYLEELKLNATKKQLNKIEELSAAIDMNTLKIYDLKSTQKVLIVDVKSLNGVETSNKIKTLFFLIENKIIRSRIVTFSDKTSFNDKDYNKMILSILDHNKDKNQYSGLISFYSPYQNKLLTDQFESGILTENGTLSLKSTKNKIGKTNGCTDWYWVTYYSNGTQTSQYVYTTCTPCEEMAYKTTNDCGGGSGGGSSSGGTGGGPSFPNSPNTNDTYDYFSPEGEHVRFQFIDNIWKIILISLPEVVVKSVPESRPYLIFDWPQDQQKAYGEGFIFTYESETGSWEGVPATDQLLAEVIEDQIDDSKLDPCPKEVMQQLKNTTNSDIVNVLKKLGASSIYTVNMVMEPAATYAETQRISKNNYVIRVDRTSSTDGTKLFKATALVHEVIHAYFLSIVDDYNYNYPTNAPMADFPELFEAYVKKTYPNPSDAQHKEMADKYVDAMASALQEYDANYTVPYQVYKDLAWGGLRDAPVFNATFPPGSAERIRITNRYNAESTGHSVGDGTPNAQTPVGKPCN
jgi:hypothetical protein